MKLFSEYEDWMRNIASDCSEMYDKYVGIPSPLPTCKLTDEPCEFESCPKRKARAALNRA